MKIYREVEQGTEQWLGLRKWKLTGSTIKTILGITVKRSPKGYETAYQLLADTHLDLSDEEDLSARQILQRWHDLEPDARERYENMTGIEVEEVGFVEKNSYLWLSPDGLINTNTTQKPKYTRAIEIKCPLWKNFVKYVIWNRIPDEYMGQVINNFLVIDDLLILDFILYHPWAGGKIPKLHVIRVTREELSEQIANAHELLLSFKGNMDELEQTLFSKSKEMLGQEIEKEKYYKVSEVADILWLKRETINKKCRDGDLICSNSGTKKRGKYLVKWSDLLDFINT